jgi:hypothetical protein
MEKDRIDELLTSLNDIKRSIRDTRSEKTSDKFHEHQIYYERRLKNVSVELLYDLSKIQRALDNHKYYLLDYRVQFDHFESIDDTTYELRGSITDYTSMMTWYLYDSKQHITDIKQRFSYKAIDVAIIDFKTPSYIIETKKAEKRLKQLGLIKNYYTTELNSLVCKYRKSLVDPKTFDELPFKYDNLMEFLKNLVENNFDDDFRSVANKFIRTNPQAIEKLKLNL